MIWDDGVLGQSEAQSGQHLGRGRGMPKKVTSVPKTVPRIDDSWLRNTDNLIRYRLESPVDRAYKLALAALTLVFGVEWRDKNIFQARTGFLKNVTDANTRLEQETHKARIVLLAEMIWNLQDMVDFDSCILQMHTPNKIESTMQNSK